VRKFLGLRYVHGGRNLNGVDCWGLVVLVYRELGVEVEDVNGYEERWSVKGEERYFDEYKGRWRKVGRDEAQFPDVVLFRNKKGIVYHAGVYLGGGKFLHCPKVGVVIGRLQDWEDKLDGFYRRRYA